MWVAVGLYGPVGQDHINSRKAGTPSCTQGPARRQLASCLACLERPVVSLCCWLVNPGLHCSVWVCHLMQAEPCSWHCQHIEVVSSTGEYWLFPCNAWLKHPASRSSSSSTTGPAAGLKQAAAVAAAALSSPRAASAGAQSRLVLQPAPSLEAMWQQQQLEMEQLRLQQQEKYRVAVFTSEKSTAGGSNTTPQQEATNKSAFLLVCTLA